MNSGNDNQWTFYLYVADKSLKTDHAVAMLKQTCEIYLEGRYDIEVIDVMEDPVAAMQENILATPTLIRKLPEPNKRIVGDLSDIDNVALMLDIISEK